MQAIINASGEGTRLRPLTCTRPPALLPVCGVPAIECLIQHLASERIDNVIVLTGYMGRDVEKALQGRSGVKTVNASPGGVSALKEYASLLEEEFFYFSSVCVTECSLTAMYDFHKKKGSYATLMVTKGGNGHRAIADRAGRVTRFEEKRLWDSASSSGGGIYVLKRGITRFIPEDTDLDIGETLLPSLVRAKMPVYAYISDKITENMDDFSSYMRANFAMAEKRGRAEEPGAIIDKGALLEAPCYVAEGAHIKKGAKIGAYSIIGKGVTVSSGVSVKRSLVMDGCRLSAGASLRGCVIDSNVTVGRDSAVYEQAVVGFGTKIGENSVLRSFVKVWPEKTVGDGQNVVENIMWGQRRRESLFEDERIRGVINSDITPEVCIKIGACLGTVTDGGEIGVSGDGTPQCDMLRDALISGALSAGSPVRDFGEQPLPITRRGAAFYFLKGAAAITTFSEEGEQYAEITLLGEGGIDIFGEMKERLAGHFERGDVLRAEAQHIKEREYSFEYKLYYLKGLIGSDGKRNASLKILLSCGARWARRLIASAAADFGSSVSVYSPPVKEDGITAGFAAAVAEGGFDMGFVIDPRCERLRIVSQDGRIIDGENYEALTALIVMKKYPGAEIIVPLTAPSAIEKMAEKYGAPVRRTKSAAPALMNELSGEDGAWAEEFIFRFDAVGAGIKLMDYLSANETSVTELLKELPDISMMRTEVEIKGEDVEEALVRVRRLSGAESDSPEGVKITFDKGWVVVIPDKHKNVCRVVSDGCSAEAARELCDICVDELCGGNT